MKKLSLYVFLVLLMTSACSEQNQLSECIEGDCVNGYGTYSCADGDKYVGEWKSNKHHGQGTFTWASGEFAGDKYVGKFKDDKRHGQGTYTSADGTIVKGIWKNGKPVKEN